MTAVIVLIGAAVLVWALSSTERRRTRTVGRLDPGDPSSRVVQVLGPPAAVCPPGTMEHVLEHLPPGFAPAAEEAVLNRLQQETRERWIYPLRRDAQAGCAPRGGMTEIGLDASRRVLWYVPVTGRTEAVLPDEYLPDETGASE